MKNLFLFVLVLILLLSACDNTSTPSDSGTLTLTDGDSKQPYSLATLQTITQTESSFDDISYIGVSISALLEHAGIAADELTSVRAIASDGFAADYDAALFLRDDVILAFGLVDGEMTADDGTFRMVLPGEEGFLNVRQVIEIEVLR
jgi:hypothetical protein